ncbi:MAG: adenylate/guanylate cyclase domain-containing protein [Bacteroidales bacterium]|nr:adenylate/guanylate cyclase domain-containing protein [Bacteroidales bacterium]
MKNIPKFFGFRIYFISTLLYLFLVMPIAGILLVKYGPEWLEKNNIINDSTNINNDSKTINVRFSVDSIAKVFAKIDTSEVDMKMLTPINKNIDRDTDIDTDTVVSLNKKNEQADISEDSVETDVNNKGRFTKTISLLFRTLILSFILGMVFNMPFNKYFRKKRKKRFISKKLFNYCKKFILKSPIINVSIFLFPFILNIFYMIYVIIYKDFVDDLTRRFYLHFFFISLVSSLLLGMFVYFWEKHRVHIKYIDHIYSKEELKKRIFNLKVGKIRNRLWISSAMTTLLPLAIVVFYLFLSVTTIKELGLSQMSSEQLKILFGKYIAFFSNVDTNDFESFVYVNAFDTMLMFIGIFTGIAISIIYILFFVNWTTSYIVGPVKELLINMQKTGRGEMDQFGVVRTNDEIGELTEGYNEMSLKIRNYIDRISRINKANSRFVPNQFLEFLEKESIEDISLGDQVQKEMTVLFSDIRSFTSISEEMTPKENFDFLNKYLGYMEPVIRTNSGFIDKYIGDSIMALFSDNVENAIDAAIEIRQKLTEFNKLMIQNGKPVIDNGIGIHSGNLMLGIIGGEGRIDGTVISDSVNLTARLEGLTKLYGASIIISEDVLIRINDPGQYNYRFLDIVKVKGKKTAVYIFEILDGDKTDNIKLKLETKSVFAEAIQLYKNLDFEKALNLFEKVYKINKDDKAAALYIKRCEYFCAHGAPDAWDGIEIMDDKF